MAEGEIKVNIPVNDYSSIEVVIDGDDFLLEVARRKPRPLYEVGLAHFGAAFQGVLSHPLDTGSAYWFGLAYMGELDFVWPKASTNARYILRVLLDNMTASQNLDDRRAALKMLLLFYEADVRGLLYTKVASRLAGGVFMTSRVFRFYGRAPGVRNIPLGSFTTVFAHNTLMSTVGALIKAGIKVARSSNPNDRTGHIVGPYTFLNAAITGDDTIIYLPAVFGTEQYFKLRNYLREHPEAIQINEWELKVLDALVDWLFGDFASDPAKAIKNSEARGGILI